MPRLDIAARTPCGLRCRDDARRRPRGGRDVQVGRRERPGQSTRTSRPRGTSKRRSSSRPPPPANPQTRCSEMANQERRVQEAPGDSARTTARRREKIARRRGAAATGLHAGASARSGSTRPTQLHDHADQREGRAPSISTTRSRRSAKRCARSARSAAQTAPRDLHAAGKPLARSLRAPNATAARSPLDRASRVPQRSARRYFFSRLAWLILHVGLRLQRGDIGVEQLAALLLADAVRAPRELRGSAAVGGIDHLLHPVDRVSAALVRRADVAAAASSRSTRKTRVSASGEKPGCTGCAAR